MNRPLQNVDELIRVSNEVGGSDPAGLQALFEAVMRAAARSDPYGRDPHDPLPPAGWPAFAPGYVAILFLGLGTDWSITVNHACYSVPAGNGPATRLQKAIDVLRAKIAQGKDFGDEALRGLNPYEHRLADANHQEGRDFDSRWFKDFKFASQNEMFIYLYHPGVEVTMYEDALISFKNQGSDGMPRHQNFSFFNTRLVPTATVAGLEQGTLIRMENHATKENGSLLQPNEKREYSMDIKFQVDGGDAGLITLIIDPDTGNGTGNEP